MLGRNFHPSACAAHALVASGSRLESSVWVIQPVTSILAGGGGVARRRFRTGAAFRAGAAFREEAAFRADTRLRAGAFFFAAVRAVRAGFFFLVAMCVLRMRDSDLQVLRELGQYLAVAVSFEADDHVG